MLLTLSIDTQHPETIVRKAATKAHCHAKIKWGRPATPPYLPAECRFQLLERQNNRDKPASSAAHDVFIRALFQADPNATIRTARAVYEGAKDFEAQCAARVD